MANDNMTVGAVTGETTPYNGKMSRIRKVTFTHTDKTKKAHATTPFTICGELLRLETTGGDDEWECILRDGTNYIWTNAAITATSSSFPLYLVANGAAYTDHISVFSIGIPICGTLTCATSVVAATTAPTITVYWRESD